MSDESAMRQASVWRRIPPEMLVSALSVALIHAIAIPRSFWEFDETLFASALRNYDPWRHHPPPPGYPVFIALGKMVNLLAGDPLVSLLTISYVCIVIGFVVMALAFTRLAGNRMVGVMGALIFYLSPTMLIHGTVPQSDPLALCVFAFALWTSALLLEAPSARRASAFGLIAALNVGCRPQFSIVILPLLMVTVILIRGIRPRLIVITAFALGCLAWVIPLAQEAGGLYRLYEYELGQAAYYAAHDAKISRGGWSDLKIAGRFIARPWGPVWLAAVVLLMAMAGFVHLARRRTRMIAPVALAAGAYLAFALATMDPADGARYALPSVVAIAFFAAAGLGWATNALWRRSSGIDDGGLRAAPQDRSFASVAATIAIALISVVYTSSIIAQRSRIESPPARAAAWVTKNVPKGSVILVELPLWPHAEYWLSDYRLLRIDDGMPRFARELHVPVYIFADGPTSESDGVTFRWETSHAYEKLTRNHYRVVSVVPWGPEDRFSAVRGVYGAERDARESWRWLAREAELVLPDIDARGVSIEFGLTKTAPIASNTVTVSANDRVVATVSVARGARASVSVPLMDGENRITIRTGDAFVPAEAAGGSGDPRELAVRLMDLDQY